MINTQYINLNMTPSGVLPVLHCSQYDIGRPLGVVVYDGSAEMDLDDYTVTIEATRTDGTPITAAVTTDGNVGAFVTTATMTNKEDLYPAQLVIVDGDSNRVASLPFMMCVVKAAMDENSEAIEEDAPLYQQYNAAIQALIVNVRAEITAEATARQAADATLQSNINSEASIRATQDAVLSARMDTFASLPDGSTAGDAELLDIRIGGDGKTYPSAGDAVRAQYSHLSEEVDATVVTPNISRNTYGTTIATDGERLKIYGTVTSVRRICFLNGQDFTATTGTEFSKTLDAGTYVIHADCTGSRTTFRIDGTYSTYSSPFVICSDENKDVVMTFTSPVMIGLYISVDSNYGTSESPSYVSVNANRITANDNVARKTIESVEGYNSVHSPGYQNAYAGILYGVPTFSKGSDAITVNLPRYGHGRAFWTVGRATDAKGAEARTFTVAKNCFFVYDTVATDYTSREYTDLLATDIICFWYTSGGAVVGPWVSYLALQKANEFEENIDYVPDYYSENNYLGNKISTIETIGSDLDIQSLRFVFITDYHVGKNARISPTLAAKIMRETGIKELYFNGDYNDKASTPLGGYKVLCDFMDAVKPLEYGNHVHYTTGNHEYNNPSAQEPALQLPRAPLFQLFNSYDTDIVSLDSAQTNAYYVDYKDAKIRVYGIDCDYDSTISIYTRKLMFDSLLEVPEGYAVLVTSHVGKASAGAEELSTRFAQIMECCAAMNDGTSITFNFGSPIGSVTYDFSGRARTFIGALTGHTHVDDYIIYDGRFPVIITESDGIDSERQPNRSLGTITEQAFEVVQIDVTTKRIYCTRIGDGNDRTFSFGTGAGLIT